MSVLNCRFTLLRQIGFIGLIGLMILPKVIKDSTIVYAQDNGQKTLTYNIPAAGTITNDKFQESWILTAPATDRISVAVQRSSDTLVPEVEIHSADNKIIAAAEHDNSYSQATIASTKLPAAATYTVVVSRLNNKAGKTTGSYDLTVNLLGAGVERPELFRPMPEPLTDSVTYKSELTNAKWADVWPIHTDGSEHVLFIATRALGTLIPTLTLLDSNGKEIQRAEPEPERDNVKLDVTLLPYTDYQLRVARTSNQDGTSEGQYTLLKVVLGGSKTDSLVKGTVEFDSTQRGQIQNRIWQEAWVITVDKPTLLTITATRTSGTLVPAIKLLDSKGNELLIVQAPEPFTTATIDNSLFRPGDYLLIVYRTQGMTGATTGEYELKIAKGKP